MVSTAAILVDIDAHRYRAPGSRRGLRPARSASGTLTDAEQIRGAFRRRLAGEQKKTMPPVEGSCDAILDMQ